MQGGGEKRMIEMVKENGKWVKYVSGICPNCDREVRAKSKKWFRGMRCKCGHYVDKVYFA